MKRKLSVGIAAAFATFVFASSAQASLILHSQFFTEGPIGNPAAEEAYVEGLPDTPNNLTYLRKYDDDANAFENGALSSGITVTETADHQWTVQWNLAGTGFQLRYVLIKDGFVQGEGHLYRLYTVTPDQYLNSITPQTVTFNNPVRNISHATFLGTQGGGVTVPDGGATLALLGGALLGIGALRRRFNV